MGEFEERTKMDELCNYILILKIKVIIFKKC